jgi:hypothetical protein
MTHKSRNTGEGSGHHMTVKMLANDPTTEQIREECLLIQSGWTEDERQRRIVGLRNPELTVMETRLSFDD